LPSEEAKHVEQRSRARLLVEQRNAELRCATGRAAASGRNRQERRKLRKSRQRRSAKGRATGEANIMAKYGIPRISIDQEQRRLEKIAAKQERDARKALETERGHAAYLDQVFKKDAENYRERAKAFLKACQLKMQCLKENRDARPGETLSVSWKLFDFGVVGPDGERVSIIAFALSMFTATGTKPMYMTAAEYEKIGNEFIEIAWEYAEFCPDAPDIKIEETEHAIA
jgi:hypothetical protein